MALLVSALGALLMVAGMVTMVIGGALAAFAAQIIVGGLLLLAGLAIERWRYKPILHRPPDPGWMDTGERFIDPETDVLTAVYLDATSGERHYVAVDR